MNRIQLTRISAALVCLLLSILVSCQKEPDQQTVEPVMQKITVTEAKEWYEQHLGSATAANARKKQKKSPKWDYASTHIFQGKEVIEIP